MNREPDPICKAKFGFLKAPTPPLAAQDIHPKCYHCCPHLTSPLHPILPSCHHGNNTQAGPGHHAPQNHWGHRGCRR